MPIFESEFTHRARVDAPIDVVFDRLTDHEAMSEWPGVGDVTLVKEGTPRNGLGAVRRVKVRGLSLDEEVVHWDPPHAFHYTITKGLPVEHLGRVTLREEGGGTVVEWHIRMKSKVPLLAKAVVAQLRGGLPRALAHFRAETEAAVAAGDFACAAE